MRGETRALCESVFPSQRAKPGLHQFRGGAGELRVGRGSSKSKTADGDLRTEQRSDLAATRSEEIEGEFVERGFWRGTGCKRRSPPGRSRSTPTRSPPATATSPTPGCGRPFVNPEGLRFTVYRNGFFSEFGKLLGMQDIEVGDPEFDDAFIIKGTDEFKVRELFAEDRLRALTLAQPTIRLSVKDHEGWFGVHFPKEVDELHFQVVGVLKDRKRLKALFDLFSSLLDRLCAVARRARKSQA